MKDFENFCFRKTYHRPPPPRFLGGPGMEGGPNFGLHPPPNQKPVGTALTGIQVNTTACEIVVYLENKGFLNSSINKL